MSKPPSIAKALAVIAIAAILGAVAGYVLYDVIEYRLPSGEWQPVSVGQDKAVQILGMDINSKSGSVYYYIQTSQGKVYACYDALCDLATASPVTRTYPAAADYTPPQPPGEVRESFIGPSQSPGLCTGQTNYIILTDGSVWAWSKTGCCEMGCFVVLIYPLVGLVLGCVVGIGIVIDRRMVRRASRFLGWLSLIAAAALALVGIFLGFGWQCVAPIIVGLMALGIILLLVDSHSRVRK